MKAEIDATGKLSIIPETELEAFALFQWWSNYTKEDSTERFATLEVCRFEIQCNGKGGPLINPQ